MANVSIVELEKVAAEAESSGTLAASALSEILSLIHSGELAPGAVVNEVYLARRFGMSRGPVREAIKTLEGRKLVTRTAYKRARVTELDSKQVQEIFELRQCLEGMACRLAARVMSDQELQDLVAIAAEAPSALVCTQKAVDFHQTIVLGCGNSRIQAALGPEIYDLVRLYRGVKWEVTHEGGRSVERHGSRPSKEGPTEHWQIARAMLARDEDLAESLMRAHLDRVRLLILDPGTA